MGALRRISASTLDARTVTVTTRWRRATLVTLFVLLACACQGLLADNASALTGIPCPQTGLETVATDAPDYPPGSTVHITGTGYAPACDATVQITRPDSVVESFTATTDLEGNLAYDYLLPPPPGVIGDYALDILGLNGVLASMMFTDGGVRIRQQDVSSDPGFANQTDVFGVGDTSYVRAFSADATRGYRFEAFNAAGTSVYLGSCKTGSTAPSDSYAPTTISGSSSAQWKWVVHEWTSNNCTTGPQSEDADNTFTFPVAQPTVYSDSGLTTPQTIFGPSGIAYVVVNGFIPGHSDAEITWIKPNGLVACANTGSSDRPDSSSGGRLPDTAGSFLQFPPNASATGDVWNQNGLYDSTCLTATFAANPGTWKLKVTPKGAPDKGFTVPVFTVDTTPPSVTINQASAQVDPTTGSPINFTATFSEAVTGFSGSDVSFTGSTAGTGGTPTGLSATVTGGPTVYNVAVSGMATRGNVVVSIPAGSAQDAATNGNTVSTSTDNSVTWDRVPVTTAPTFSPASPKTNDTLTASSTTSDPDGDNISVAWTWKVNRGGNVCTVQTNSSASAPAGVRTATLDLSQNYAPTSCTGAMINPLNPSKGDVVRVEATPNDGLFDGTLQSSNITIVNTLPTVTLSGGNNLSPNEGSTYTYNYSISDADGDTIASVATSCGTGSKTNASNTDTSGSFDCTFADGLASTSVSAQATDTGFGAGAGNNATQSISVQNVVPSIAISGAASVDEGSTYTLTLGAVTDPGTDTVSDYAVNWGDGSTSHYTTAGAKTHSYADGPNDWEITVDLTDEDGTFFDAANDRPVHVNNVAPSIALSNLNDLTVDESGITEHTYSYSISDPGTDNVDSVSTSCGADGVKVNLSDTNTNTSGSFKCTFPDGSATTSSVVSASATDDDGDTGNTDTQTVSVHNVAPTAHLSGDDEVFEGTTHTYTFTVTDPGTDSFTVNTPDYPDCGTGGDYVGGSLSTNAGGGSFQCTFPDGPATTEVKIRVTDSDGASDTDTENVVVVDVLNVDPVVTLTGPSPVAEGSTHTYSYTTADDGSPETFSRDAQSCDGGTLSADTFNPVDGSGSFDCTYADGPSAHNPTVTVSDGDGGFDSDSVAVTASNVAPSIAISGVASVDEGSTYTLTLGAVTDPGTDTVSDYAVNWGDGSTSHYTTAGAKTHSYADGPNDWEITVDLTDEDGTFFDAANDRPVHVNNVAPATPNLTSPADNATTGENTPAFDWSDSTDPAGANDTITYRIQVDNDCDFSSPERNQATSSSDFTPAASLADGTYCWRVNASDEDGDSSAYSSVRHLTIDTAAPTVQSIDRAGGNPTNASGVDWTVTLSESVSGVDASDFALVESGGVAGASITGVSGSGTTYTVTANTGTGNGSLGLNLNDNDSVIDAGGNSLRAQGGGADGSFTGQVYTIDKTGPTVTVNQAVGQADPTSGSPIHFTAVFSEPVSGFGNGDVTVGGTAGASNASVTNPSADNRTFDIAISDMATSGTVTASIDANKAQDAAGNNNYASTSTDNTVTWNQQTSNTAPAVTITSPTFGQLYAKGSANVNLAASWVDPDAGQTHTCSINWDDGAVTTPVVNEGARTCAQSHTYANAGVYTINVTICDNAGGCGSAEVWVVVYDPSAGFVTGGGWIDVAPGSYPLNPTLRGRANFGFNSKYKNGVQPPTGQTEFNFSVANFNFHSETYQWLVVSSFKAQYRGTGSVNGVPGYDFRLTGYDGQISGGGGIDKFRIKITRNGQTIFDNRMGVPEDVDVADPQAIAGGSIVIHK